MKVETSPTAITLPAVLRASSGRVRANAVLALIGLGLIITSALPATGGGPGSVALAVVLPIGVAALLTGVNVVFARVISEDHAVRYRRWFRTRTISRADIESISVTRLTGTGPAAETKKKIAVTITLRSPLRPVAPVCLRANNTVANRLWLQEQVEILRSGSPPEPIPPQVDHAREALHISMAQESSEVDRVAVWLLRIGIDHSGELTMNRLWDAAVRAMVLVDLQRNHRLTESDDAVQVDTHATGVSYEDAACEQLLSESSGTELEWIANGQLRASDVAAHLVDSGEWTAHLSVLGSGWHKYAATPLQYIPLRRRLAHTYDGDFAALSDFEAALAVIGHALNVVRPLRLTMRPGPVSPLRPDQCGALAAVVSAAVDEILAAKAAGMSNPNPTW